MVEKYFFKLFFLIIFLSNACYLQAQTSEFEQFVKQTMLDRTVAGVSIARIESGEIVEQFALTHPEFGSSPVTESTVFQVGSISKPVAAWAIMSLIRDGKVELDAPISRYVSRWQLPPSSFDPEQVTVKRLLSHTAGLSLHGYPGFSENQELPTIEASLSGNTNGAGDVQLVLTPGQQFQYSGGGYTLLQLMVEEVTGMPFAEYAQQAVLTPLGMANSSYQPTEALLTQRAVPYIRTNKIDYFQFRAQAAASLHSTASDLAKFALANIDVNPVLDEQLKGQMHSGVIDVGTNKIGLGFFIQPHADLIGHNGANQGWRAEMLFNQNLNSGLVVLTNSDNAGFFIQQVRCYWEEHFSNAALLDSCQSQISDKNKELRWLLWATWALVAATIAIAALRIYSVMSGKIQIGLPISKKRWTIIVLLGAVLGITYVLLGTSTGVWIISGYTTSLTVMDFAPEGIPNVWFALQGLLTCLMLFSFARKPQ